MSDIAREDTLDSAMSGQSHTERLIDSVCAELNAMAVDLKICHTVNGEWPAGEKDTLYKYDHLRRMAVELRKLKSARTQAPASGEVEPAYQPDKKEQEAFRKALIRSADVVHPPAKVPEGWRQALQDAFDIIQADANTEENYGSLCRIGHVLSQLTTPAPAATPEATTLKGWKLLPVHATADMVRRGKQAHGEEFLFNQDPDTNIQSIWKAMVAIAPNTPEATTPEAEWVRCSERLPTEADADDEEAVWWWVEGPAGCRTCNQVEHASWDHVRDMCLYDETLKDGSHWKPTGLKRPTPPHHRSSEQ